MHKHDSSNYHLIFVYQLLLAHSPPIQAAAPLESPDLTKRDFLHPVLEALPNILLTIPPRHGHGWTFHHSQRSHGEIVPLDLECIQFRQT
ncbi:hypothetical protein RSAG8_12677, partial [Rhizoctonia solani AG-8 WAC10335]